MVLTIKEPNIITEFFGFFFFSVIVLASIKELKYFNGINILKFKDIVILIIVLKSILNNKFYLKFIINKKYYVHNIFIIFSQQILSGRLL